MSASPNPGAQATRPAIGPLPPLEALGLPQAHDALPLQREVATKARPLQALFAPLDVPPDAPLNAHLRKRLDVETPWDSALEADAEPPQAALPKPALPTPTLATPALPAAPTPDAPDTPDASDTAHDEAPSAHAVAPANALPAPSEAVNTATSTPPSADLLHTTQPEDWQQLYANALQRVQQPLALDMRGTLTRLAGLVLEAKGLRVSVGAQCHVLPLDKAPVLAEVVGFANDRAFLMPAGDVQGLSAGAAVAVTEARAPTPRLHDAALPPSAGQGLLCLPLGAGLLGRVVDSQGTPLDHQGPLGNVATLPIGRQSLNAMDRDPVRQCLDTGVRAINGLLTVGRGQRLGLFAGSGVGKSVLLGMMARYTQADVIVVGLIGERGREVKEFIEDILGADGRARSVVVAAPADAPPLLRMQGADYASAIAEHFRDQGQHVLLLMDSLTRYAMAQREIALAIGEPPATKGYPPSCFARLPQLVERSGNGLNGVGSITAFYTVLTEGDDQQDPIADAARAILDGHIVLSRALAESGHYPAIDIEQSASRVMHNVVPEPHLQLARRFRSSYSTYAKARDLVQLGAYAAGSDPALDEAIALHPRMVEFLQQGMHEAAPLDSVLPLLQAVTTPNG